MTGDQCADERVAIAPTWDGDSTSVPTASALTLVPIERAVEEKAVAKSAPQNVLFAAMLVVLSGANWRIRSA